MCAISMILAGRVVLLLTAVLSCVAAPEQVASRERTVALYQEGAALQQRAGASQSVPETVSLLEQAIQKYEQVTKLESDFLPARAMWCAALNALARLSTDQEKRTTYLHSAMQQFDVATTCPGSDWTAYQAWAELLLEDASHPAFDAAQHQLARQELVKVCEAGMKLARFANQRARLQNDLAICRLYDGQASADPDAQVRLFQQSIELFTTANAAKADDRTGFIHAAWATAQVELGKLNGDTNVLRQAVEHFQSALQANRQQPQVQFNLACVYGALHQPDDALRHLRLCLEDDPQRRFASAAAEDPDLKLLRGNPDFEQLVRGVTGRPNAEKLYQLGVQQQRLAEKNDFPADKVAQYREAISYYTQATKAKPDYYLAQTLWAQSQFALAHLNTVTAERLDLIKAARDRYIVAAGCTDADFKAQYSIGQVLLTELDALATTDKQRRDLLEQARHAFEVGLPMARFSGDRALLLRELGTCLATLVPFAASPDERQKLLSDAIQKLDAAVHEKSDIHNAPSYELWGVSLLELSKFKNDRRLLRTAVERLQKASELDPKNTRVHYNLACCYALLSERGPSLRHLRLAVECDHENAIYDRADKEPDLKLVRGTPEYNKLFKANTTHDPLTLTTPPVKNR